MTRKLERIEPVATAPDTARGIAALFAAIGFVGAIPALCGMVVAGTVVATASHPSPAEPEWWAAWGTFVWLGLGFAQWPFHIRRALGCASMDRAPAWWFLTFVTNAAYAVGAGAIAVQDPHVGSLIATVWFALLSVFAVSAYRDDWGSGHQNLFDGASS